MKYENGAVGNLEITTAARPDNYEASISIVGSKGLAQIGGIAVNELQVFTPNLLLAIVVAKIFQAVYMEVVIRFYTNQLRRQCTKMDRT